MAKITDKEVLSYVAKPVLNLIENREKVFEGYKVIAGKAFELAKPNLDKVIDTDAIAAKGNSLFARAKDAVSDRIDDIVKIASGVFATGGILAFAAQGSGDVTATAESVFASAPKEYASKLHNDWRASRALVEGKLAADGLPMREPRWKPVSADDPAFINAPEEFKKTTYQIDWILGNEPRLEGRPPIWKDASYEDYKSYPEGRKQVVTEVDIANLDFDRLPEKFKYENFESSKGVMEILAKAMSKGGSVLSIDIEAASSEVHDQWLERNGSWAEPEQNKPYSELSEVEKAKDRAIVEGAIEHLTKSFVAKGAVLEIGVTPSVKAPSMPKTEWKDVKPTMPGMEVKVAKAVKAGQAKIVEAKAKAPAEKVK